MGIIGVNLTGWPRPPESQWRLKPPLGASGRASPCGDASWGDAEEISPVLSGDKNRPRRGTAGAQRPPGATSVADPRRPVVKLTPMGVGMLSEEHHRRRSIRLKGYDYTQPGAYFVTIVIQGRECLLGEIVDGEWIARLVSGH